MSYQDLLSAMQSFGLEVSRLETGGLMRCKAIGDKGAQRSGWYRFFDDIDAQVCVFGNWRTGERNTWAGGNQHLTATQRQYIQERLSQAQREREAEQRQRWAKSASALSRLWRNSLPIDGNTPVNRYLASRGLINPPSHALRWAKLPYHHEGEVLGYYPVMLAAVTNPSGELVTLHRTYLTAGGAKAEVPTVKKLMPCAAPMSGASIKLYAPQRRTDGGLALGVAEGIETALAAQILFGVPVWAGVSASGLVSFTPPCEVTHLYVFADNDASNTGQRAAKELAERTALLGHEVRIHTPPKVGDWADELLKTKGAM